MTRCCPWLLLLFVSGTAWGQAVCTHAATAVLRKGPGPQYEKSWIVTRYMPFMKLDKKGLWLKLSDLDGEIHWGKGSDFSSTIRCVVVRANTAETRLGPGPGYPFGEFKTLDRYTPLKRLDDQGAWMQVEDDLGNKSWIQESKLWHPVKVESVHF